MWTELVGLYLISVREGPPLTNYVLIEIIIRLIMYKIRSKIIVLNTKKQ